MFRILGGGMIFSGCLGLGLWYRALFRGRIRTLRGLKDILELLAGEVRYGRATLPECCGRVARYLSCPFDRAFREVWRRMEENRGVSFGEVFREEMGAAFEGLPLQAEDKENFLHFTSQTGFADGQMQLRAIEQSLERLCAIQEGLERESVGKSRMAVGLGAMGGLLILLVLF